MTVADAQLAFPFILLAIGLVPVLTSIVVDRADDWLRDVLDPTLRGE